MKRIATALLVTVLSSHAFAQTSKCRLSLERSPTIRGFKIGMSRAQAEAAFGQPINYSDNPKDGSGTASVSGYQFPEKLDDVITIRMRFFKQRLYGIEIVYAKGDFRSGQEVAATFSKAWNLPISSWESYKSYYNTGSLPYIERKDIRVLLCSGWGMAAQVQGVGNPKIEVSTFGTDKLIQQEAARIRRDGFKP